MTKDNSNIIATAAANAIPWNKGKHTGIVPKGAFKKGSSPWNKGIKTGQTVWNKGKKGLQKAWNKGVAQTLETREKLSKSRKGMAPWNIGKVGLQVAWNKGLHDNSAIFILPRSRFITRNVKERDNYTCQKCGLKDAEILVVDHIIPKKIRPDLNDDVKNLTTLCPNCHARKTITDRKEIALFKREKYDEK